MEGERTGFRDGGKSEGSTESESVAGRLIDLLRIHSDADDFKTLDSVSSQTVNMLPTSGVKETFLWPPVYRSPPFPVFFYAGRRRYDREPIRGEPHHIDAGALVLQNAAGCSGRGASLVDVDPVRLARAIQTLGDELRIDRIHLDDLRRRDESHLAHELLSVCRDLPWSSSVSHMLSRFMVILHFAGYLLLRRLRSLPIFTSRQESNQNAQEAKSAEYTMPDHSHPVQPTVCFRSRRDSSCLSRSHSVPSLSPFTSTKNETLTRANSLPDMLLKNSLEEFTPDIDEDDESYRFQCSCPGLYQCSVTGLLFHMEGEGDVDYRTVSWNRRLLAQHHKKPAGPLFDIKCVQQSMCQLHLPHCEIRSTGGCDVLSVAHVNDEGIEFISPHKITETHVVINITGFSAYGDVKDEDSPPVPVRALVLLFYKPPVDPDLESVLNVLLLPSNIDLLDVKRTRKKLFGEENLIQTSSHCKLHPEQEYTLSTCPEDDSVLVQPTEAEFDCENYKNYFPLFQVELERIMKHIKLLLRDTNKVKVWERRVCLSSTAVKRSGQGSSDDILLDIRSSFIDRISGPVLKSLLDKMFEKKVMTDSEREEANEIQNKRDKARFVFDTVRNKGEAASSEMTDFLCEVDPFLSEHLGLI